MRTLGLDTGLGSGKGLGFDKGLGLDKDYDGELHLTELTKGAKGLGLR